MSALQAFRKPVVLALAFSYFSINIGAYGLMIWLPKMVQQFPGLTTWQVSLVASIPYLCAIPAMLIAGWHSDRTGERKWHVAAPIMTGGIFLGASGYLIDAPEAAFLGLAASAVTVYVALPPRPRRRASVQARGPRACASP